ncbi:zinc ribbon domain-containing protein [Variovorax sp. E3]|jgi:uncharacterized membrane protein YvbJ|uniref:zinc ribbon domain-containing protein n=1 Tax=Variovorax sp. E3 TaxID=1914993 RepID=UPI0018DBD99B|nr:zinc ribbon domain-containing protein [Variovorax sp. E3]
MALIACSECGHQVSTRASHCPSCGAPVAGDADPAARGGKNEPVVNAGLLGKIVAVIGAWLVVPWAVRLVAALAAIVMMIVMFRSGR